MTNVLKTPQGREIQLNGTTYKLSPFNLYLWGELEDRLGVGLENIKDLLQTKKASTLMTMLFVFIKDNHPDIKVPTDAGKLLSTVNDVTLVTDTLKNIIEEFSAS